MYRKIFPLFVLLQILTFFISSDVLAELKVNNSTLEETILESKEIQLWDRIIVEIIRDNEDRSQLPIIKTDEEWISYLNNLNFWNVTTKEFVLNALKTKYEDFNLNKIINNNISTERINSILNISLPVDEQNAEVLSLKQFLFNRVLEFTKKDLESKNLKKDPIKQDSVQKDAMKKMKASGMKKKVIIAIILLSVLFGIFYARKFFD